MSSHLALSHKGHLAQVLHIFDYLNKYHNSKFVYDSSDPVIDESKFEEKHWTANELSAWLCYDVKETD